MKRPLETVVLPTWKWVAVSMLALSPAIASGFELSTHGQMTLAAFQQSILGASTGTFRVLGIDGFVLGPETASSPLGIYYIDMGNERVRRSTRQHEVQYFPRKLQLGFDFASDLNKLQSWLMRGAIREDDTPVIPFFSNDDPVNEIRPLNHFFDPVHNLPLTAGGRIGATLTCPPELVRI